jgi:hypothetical protein
MSLTAGTLYISSYNNAENDTSTNFNVTLSVPVNKAKRIRILGVTMAHLMMPFNYNDDEWVFAVNGVSYQMMFPIDRRWATMTDFLTYVNGTLFPGAKLYPSGTAQACPVTMSYTATTNKLTLTANTAGQVISMPAWNWNNTTGSAVAYNSNYRLGWTSGRVVTGTTTLTADGFPNVFQRTNSIYITSNLATDSNNDANIANIIGRFPVNVSWGGLIVYENVHSDFAAPVFTESMKTVHFQLLDEDYQPLINPDNAYFNIQLGIEY